MAVESKPLFHPEVLRQQVRSFNLPEQTSAWQPKLRHWAGLITSGRADQFKETALLRCAATEGGPAHRERHLYKLLRASETVGRALTHQFYALYAGIRQRALRPRLHSEQPVEARARDTPFRMLLAGS